VEIVSPGVVPLIDDPRMNTVISGAGGSARVIEELASGNEVEGFLANLDGIEHAIGEMRGAYWMLELPVIVDEELAGFIGFDVCEPRNDLGAQFVDPFRAQGRGRGRSSYGSRQQIAESNQQIIG
jgi:hypothetical protein